MRSAAWSLLAAYALELGLGGAMLLWAFWAAFEIVLIIRPDRRMKRE
jgi:hypothetical protein